MVDGRCAVVVGETSCGWRAFALGSTRARHEWTQRQSTKRKTSATKRTALVSHKSELRPHPMFREITKITNVLEAQVIQKLNENTPVGGKTLLFGSFSRFDRNAFFSLFDLCLFAVFYPISHFPATLAYFFVITREKKGEIRKHGAIFG